MSFSLQQPQLNHCLIARLTTRRHTAHTNFDSVLLLTSVPSSSVFLRTCSRLESGIMRVPPLFLAAVFSVLLRLVVSETTKEFLLRHQQARGDDGLAPLYGTDLEDGDRFPDEYIVMFYPGYTLEEHFETIGMNLSNTTRFQTTSSGYSAELDDITLNSRVRLDPGVLLVESNGPIDRPQPVESNANASTIVEMQKREYVEGVEQDAPYGLQMISAARKLETPVSDHGEYDYVWGAGRGVNVYVFDSG